MKKTGPRTYGTGTLRQLPSGKWLFEYKPKWSPKRLSKTVESATAKAAQKLLSDWIDELDKRDSPLVAVSIDDLIALHVDDMTLNSCEPKNILETERKPKKHLGTYFATYDFVVPLKKANIKAYKKHRVAQGAKPSTINRELSWLHRCLTLGNNEELISVPIPAMEKFDETRYIRTGIYDDEKYYAILRRLPAHAQPVWCLAYRNGIRRGEILKLLTEWLLPHWKKPEPYIEIPGFDGKGNRITKSGKPHVIPLRHPEVRALLDMTLSDPARNPKCPYLFQYRGKRLTSIRTCFENARREGGLDGSKEGVQKMIFHDTRRSAAIQMDEAGLDREEAKEMAGWQTDSMWERYRIGKASQAVKSGRKLWEHQERNEVKAEIKSANESANRRLERATEASAKNSVN